MPHFRFLICPLTQKNFWLSFVGSPRPLPNVRPHNLHFEVMGMRNRDVARHMTELLRCDRCACRGFLSVRFMGHLKVSLQSNDVAGRGIA